MQPLLRAATYDLDATPADGASPDVTPLPAALRTGPLATRENHAALELLLAERRDAARAGAAAAPPFWLAVVPGTSEAWGHHRAPPAAVEARGVRVSPEFAARLAHAAALLAAGVARFVLVSGGAIDAARPDYVEAVRGREHLLAHHAGAAPDLARRVLIDPIARHSHTNLRNAAKLCVELGLDRVLIATTTPSSPWLWPRGLPVLEQTTQGWYFLHHRASTFDLRCKRGFGYALGTFAWVPPRNGAGPSIALYGWDAARLRADAFGP